ncbi:DNA polymerase III subunit gamma/tau [Streptomyces werraensis]|uniref:DNA polymerase III subunit gamma/tau n=1 Tax=Streptomyces werraensis TaxID=68284 RepID=UPI003F4DA278
MLWPNILETVKNRRRFTWILLSQNAQVTGFDGTTLQLGFVNAGARDNFLSSGSEDVLRQALAEQFNVQWKIEAVVDLSGGGGPAASGPAGGPSGGRSGGGTGYGAPSGGGYGAPGGGPGDTRRPSTPQASAPAAPSPAPSAPAPAAPSRPAVPEPPPPVSPEDDIPEDDDPDLDESALSGKELLVRELGATVVEEITNE